jgi:hypothetical protein
MIQDGPACRRLDGWRKELGESFNSQGHRVRDNRIQFFFDLQYLDS